MRARYLTARLTLAVLLLGLMSVGITAATTAQAGSQLFTAEWYIKWGGNECGGTGMTGPHCTNTTNTQFQQYSNLAIPQGILCNAYNPRCPFVSTPTNGMGSFSPLGGSTYMAIYCTPYTNFGAMSRPAKGGTVTTGMYLRKMPPLYRNPQFFTSGGLPKVTACAWTSTGFDTINKTRFGKYRGKVQQGNPIAGTWDAMRTGTQLGGFTFAAAPAASGAAGIRTTGQTGAFPGYFYHPYIYTYANLRNDQGVFGPGTGPGSFNVKYVKGANTVASINVKQGAAKFGGTMQMLGSLTTKVCYNVAGFGCYLGSNRWRYEVVGASGVRTLAGVVTGGYIATDTAQYYNTALMFSTTVTQSGSRFPWTTGSVTVTATGRGLYKTVEYAHGYDNRNTTTPNGLGTIQLVSPALTRWFGFGGQASETGGIAVLRIKFIGATTDSDIDGVPDALDNCSDDPNPAQDDTDGDDCGNICDADYDQNGIVGWSDYGFFTQCFGTTTELCQHLEPIGGGRLTGFPDFGELTDDFGEAPGPSGSTAGTTACP